MRKITLLILFGFLCSWTNFAQVIVGPQSGTTNAMPISSCLAYSYSQQLIYQSDINATAGDITSISFYFDRTTSTSNSSSAGWTIYMGHTTKTEFSNNDDWLPIAELTQVYIGTVTYPAAGNQMLITFDTPFPYNNTDNLVVAVDENQPGFDCSNYFGKTPAMGAGRSIYYRSDTENPDPASPPTALARTNFINNVILGGLQESCPRPTDLTIISGTDTTADLSWSENGVAAEWEVVYGIAGFNPVTEGTTVMDDDGTPGLSITGLNANTLYDFYVRAICGVDEQSALVGPTSYNTGCGISTAPFTEGFESGFTDQQALGGCWSQSSVTGTETWMTNNTMTTYNRAPHSGGWNIFLRYGNEDWIFYPLSLTGGSSYELRFYARQDSSNGANASIQAAYGLSDTPAAMTNTIIPSTPLVNGDYQEFAEFFTPTNSGIYYIGIKGKISSSPWYISLDDISVEEASGCLRPGALAVGTVTDTTAEVSWTPNGPATEWNVIYGIAGFDPETGGATVTVSDLPQTTLTGLTIDTGYEFYVRSICGAGDESSLSSSKYFFTGYCQYTSTSTSYYINNFQTTDGAQNITNLNSGQSPNGYGNFTNKIVATYPSGSFDFNVSYGSSSTSSFGFNMWIDYNGNMEFEESEKVYASAGYSTSEQGTITVPAGTPNGNYRIRIVNDWLNTNPAACGASAYGEAEDYTLMVVDQPTCMPVSDLIVTALSHNTATVGWTPFGTETEWAVIYGAVGFDPLTAGTTIPVTGTPTAIIDNLDPNTSYDFYVKAICSPTDESFLAGPVSFTTSCVPASIPFSEGFETGYVHDQALGGCWSQTSITGGNPWTLNNTFINYNRTPHSGAWNVTLRYGNEDWMYYPLELTGGTAYMLTFYARQDSANGANASIQAAYGAIDTPAGMTTTIVPSTPLVNGNYQEFSEFFTPTTSGVYYLGIKGTISGSPWYISLDDISVEEASGCLRPGALSVGEVTETTAIVSWTENGSATEWEVVYGLAGFDPETQGTTVSVTGTPETTLTGLVSDTGYEFYVRAICGVGEESTLSSPKYFFTGYCQYTSTSTNYYINNFVTEEAIQNISNTNSGLSPNGYGNFTSMVVTTFAGGSFDFSASYAGNSTYGFNMWIDYNRNMEFEPAEKVISTGYSSGAQGTITVPMGTENGNYRIRIVADYLSSNPEACGTSTYGEAEDYTLMIIDAPSCMPPRGVAVVGVTETTADVSWTPWGTETEWDIIYGAPGFNPETEGTIQNHVGGIPAATITGLTPSTAYDFYVRGVCGVDDVSIWTGPGTFVTECVALNLPYFLGFEETTPPNIPICTSVQNLSNGNEWEVANVNENGFTGRALRYKWNSNSAANTWFYTQGLNLTAGVDYQISYKYGNNGSAFHEKMKVAFGTSPESTYMTNELADYTDITGGTPTEEELVFTVPADGVYYFGFNAYTPADQFYLFVDNILVKNAAECEIASDVQIVEVTDTTVSVSWTGSPTATEGYTVDVFLEGGNPNTDTPVASATVGAGETSATVTGLDADTSYDVYVTSDCGEGNIVRSEVINFVTTDLGVGANDYAQISYFPNPVKEQLTITAASPIESVTVYNLLGQAVMQIEPRDLNVVLDMSALPTGTYVLKATVANAVSTFKIVKE